MPFISLRSEEILKGPWSPVSLRSLLDQLCLHSNMLDLSPNVFHDAKFSLVAEIIIMYIHNCRVFFAGSGESLISGDLQVKRSKCL